MKVKCSETFKDTLVCLGLRRIVTVDKHTIPIAVPGRDSLRAVSGSSLTWNLYVAAMIIRNV